jgi:hypothetical protein
MMVAWNRSRRAPGTSLTPEDREAQLCDLELLCDRIADLLAEHGDTYNADLIGARADGARELQATGYSQSELNELAGGFPSGPDWLNPKALDYGAPRKPWQDEVARLQPWPLGPLRTFEPWRGSIGSDTIRPSPYELAAADQDVCRNHIVGGR